MFSGIILVDWQGVVTLVAHPLFCKQGLKQFRKYIFLRVLTALKASGIDGC